MSVVSAMQGEQSFPKLDAEAPAFGALARERLDRGDLDGARLACLEGFAENPRWTEGALLYLEVLARLVDLPAAREIYAQAIIYEPLSPELRLAFAAVLEAAQHPREAQRLAIEAADLAEPKAPYDALLARLTALAPKDSIPKLGPPPTGSAVQALGSLQGASKPSTEPEKSAETDAEEGKKKKGERFRTAEIRKPQLDAEVMVTDANSPVLLAVHRPRWPLFAAVGAAVAITTALLVVFWPGGEPASTSGVPSASASASASEQSDKVGRVVVPSTPVLEGGAMTPPKRTPKTAPETGPATAKTATKTTPKAVEPSPVATKPVATKPSVVQPKATTPSTKVPEVTLPAKGAKATAPKTPAPKTPVLPQGEKTPPIRDLAAVLARRYPAASPQGQLQRAIAAAEAGKRRQAVIAGYRALTRLRMRRRAFRRDHLVLLAHLGGLLSKGPRWMRSRARDILHNAARWPRAPLAVYFHLGRVYLTFRDVPRAVWCFRRATAKAPRLAQAHLELAGALWRKGSWRGMARRSYRRFLRLAPKHPAAPRARRLLRR